MAIHVDLVGIRLIGDLPLGVTEIRLGQGLTVLGGVNGAGKSTVLEALGDALSGRMRKIEGADLIFQIGQGPEPRGEDLYRWMFRLLGTGSSSLGETKPETLDDFLACVHRASMATLNRDSRRPGVGSRFDPETHLGYEPMLNEALAQRTLAFCLRSVASRHEPRTALFVAAVPGVDTPTIQTELGSAIDSERSNSTWPPSVVAGMPLERSLLSRLSRESDLPVPLVPVRRISGTVTQSRPGRDGPTGPLATVMQVETLSPVNDPDKTTTTQFAANTTQDNVGGANSGEPLGLSSVVETAERWAAGMSEAATATWDELRPDQAQPLECRVSADVTGWAQGRFFEWHTHDPIMGDNHPIEHLSAGQLRWAGLAVAFALADETVWAEASPVRRRTTPNRRPRAFHWWLLDEPELGMHRAVEKRVGNDLREIAHRRNLYIVAASHSSEIMKSADVLLGTNRNTRGIEMREVKSPRDSLATLGLEPIDLMGWYRGFLLVEGMQDEQVIAALLGAQLEARRIKIYRLGGSKNLAAGMQTQVLLDTKAAIIGVLDNVSAGEASELRERALTIYAADGYTAAKLFLDKKTKGRGSERSAIKASILEALSSPEIERFSVLGLPESDVLRYLPPKMLCDALPDTWDEIAATYGREHGVEVDPTTWAPDKSWVGRKYSFTLGDAVPLAAARLAREEIPADFASLLDDIDASLDSSQRDEFPRIDVSHLDSHL